MHNRECLNGDGIVDALDLAIAMDNLGSVLLHVEWNADSPVPDVFGPNGEVALVFAMASGGSPPPGCQGLCCGCCGGPCPCCGPGTDPGGPCGLTPCAECEAADCDADCGGNPCDSACTDHGGGPCGENCPTADCNPMCGADPCGPECRGSGFECHISCNPGCIVACGGDPCDPACADHGGGPCGEKCPNRFCNSTCDDYDPCNQNCDGRFCDPLCDDYEECHENCNPECNANCDGNPCDEECEGIDFAQDDGFVCCEVDICLCEPGEMDCCDNPETDEETPIVCVGTERQLCVPDCPEGCEEDCEPDAEWSWSAGDDGVEFPNGDEGRCVRVKFVKPGQHTITASHGCCTSPPREFIAVDIRLDAVTFWGNNHPVARDTTGNPYEVPHWLSARAQAEKEVCNAMPDDCCNGNWDEDCEDQVQERLGNHEDRRHPVAYTRSTDEQERHMTIRHATLHPNGEIDKPRTIFHIDTGGWAIETLIVKKVVATTEHGGTPIGTWDSEQTVPIPLQALANSPERAPHKYVPAVSIALDQDEGGALPTTIAYHPEMITEWTIEINGRDVSTVCNQQHGPLRSENTLYVTLSNQPAVFVASKGAYILFHTVVDIACRRAHGLDGTNSEQIIETIWEEVPDLSVTRAQPDDDGSPFVLHYYRDWQQVNELDAEHLEYLLLHGDGQCGSWVRLFGATLAVHAVLDDTEWLTVRPPASADALLFRNWQFSEPGNSGDQAFPFLSAPHYQELWVPDMFIGAPPNQSHNWANSDATDLHGLEGQGNTNPLNLFSRHILLNYESWWYDPSIGRRYTGELDMEQQVIAGFSRWIEGAEYPETILGIDVNEDGEITDAVVEWNVFWHQTVPPGGPHIRFGPDDDDEPDEN
jgi:hypothetical protein